MRTRTLPFEKLVEELQPERDLSRQPLFQVMFALQNVPRETLELPGLRLRPMERGAERRRSSICRCTCTETADGLAGSIEYATDLFEASTIERLLAQLSDAAGGDRRGSGAADVGAALLSDAERERIVVEWNDDDGGVSAG